MNVSLLAMDWKRRALTIATWVLLILSPVVLMLILSGLLGRNAFQSTPTWTDELDYWRAVYSWLHVGSQTGYSGIGEMTAAVGTLSVHGLSPLLLYAWLGAIFGWGINSIVYFNCLWVAAGALTFCALVRPRAGVAALMSLALMVYAPVVLYCATSMTEFVNYGLLLFYLAFLLRLAIVRREAAKMPNAEPSLRRGLAPLILCTLTVLLCCTYRITYVGLFIPLAVVVSDFRWSRRLAIALATALVLSFALYCISSLYASPFSSGFLYNFLHAGSAQMALQMFLSHAKANLYDYFIRDTSNAMESLQRWLYCGVALWCLLASFMALRREGNRLRVHFKLDSVALMGFLTLFLPFAIVVCAYETNDWSDYRTLAPFLWLVIAAMLARGRKLLPALYLAGCAAILAVLVTGAPVGAFGDADRFSAIAPNEGVRELCDAVKYDPAATDPFDNTVRTDMFNADTIAMLDPHIGIQTGWFTPETVGKSRWILTDHLKIPVEGYVQVYRNIFGYVYEHTDAAGNP